MTITWNPQPGPTEFEQEPTCFIVIADCGDGYADPIAVFPADRKGDALSFAADAADELNCYGDFLLWTKAELMPGVLIFDTNTSGSEDLWVAVQPSYLR